MNSFNEYIYDAKRHILSMIKIGKENVLPIWQLE